MKKPSLAVLDVGHGNAAVLVDTNGIVVVDGGRKGVLIDFLRQVGIKKVDVLLISHADADHILNAMDVLLDKEIGVGVVCYNSDASKDTRAWQGFCKAIMESRRRKGVRADPQLTTTQTGELDRGDVHVEILYPYPETAGTGPGGKDEGGEDVTSNSMSAVVRLTTAKRHMVMLAGDVEPGCLAKWGAENVDPSAEVLIFPHHGGNPGKHDRVKFATALVKAVQPKTVIFSIHRSLYELPMPDVVDAIRKVAPGVRIACTQLSARCSKTVPSAKASHILNYEAHGRHENACCAGTMIIDISGNVPTLEPASSAHIAFIKSLDGKPLCI
jgi:competence protein ComEC